MYVMFASCSHQHHKETRESVPHKLAEGFIVGEFPVILLREGMINILQTPLLRQLSRGLLLNRLLRGNQQSDQREEKAETGLDSPRMTEALYLCCFLLAAVTVPIVFFLLFGFLLLPFFMFLLFLLLSRSIVTGYAVRVLAVVSLSVRVSVYIAVLKRTRERRISKKM